MRVTDGVTSLEWKLHSHEKSLKIGQKGSKIPGTRQLFVRYDGATGLKVPQTIWIFDMGRSCPEDGDASGDFGPATSISKGSLPDCPIFRDFNVDCSTIRICRASQEPSMPSFSHHPSSRLLLHSISANHQP